MRRKARFVVNVRGNVGCYLEDIEYEGRIHGYKAKYIAVSHRSGYHVSNYLNVLLRTEEKYDIVVGSIRHYDKEFYTDVPIEEFSLAIARHFNM